MTRFLPTDGLGDDQAVDVEVVVVLGVGDRDCSTFFTSTAIAALGEGRGRSSPLGLLAADQLRDQVQLLRADAEHAPTASASLSPPRDGELLACSMAYFLFALLVGGVAGEGPRRREFAELVADHVLVHGDRDVLVAVVDAERQADELRQDGRATRPGLDRPRCGRILRGSAFFSR
jgi:hypothetical protein